MSIQGQAVILQSISEVRFELQAAASQGLPSYEINKIAMRLVALYACLDTTALQQAVEESSSNYAKAA